jgi:hypothetical protein
VCSAESPEEQARMDRKREELSSGGPGRGRVRGASKRQRQESAIAKRCSEKCSPSSLAKRETWSKPADRPLCPSSGLTHRSIVPRSCLLRGTSARHSCIWRLPGLQDIHSVHGPSFPFFLTSANRRSCSRVILSISSHLISGRLPLAHRRQSQLKLPVLPVL